MADLLNLITMQRFTICHNNLCMSAVHGNQHKVQKALSCWSQSHLSQLEMLCSFSYCPCHCWNVLMILSWLYFVSHMVDMDGRLLCMHGFWPMNDYYIVPWTSILMACRDLSGCSLVPRPFLLRPRNEARVVWYWNIGVGMCIWILR